MLIPPVNPHVVGQMANQLQQRNLAPAPPVQAVTARPAMPSPEKEKAQARDKRDRDRKGDTDEARGHKTDFSV